MGDRRFRVLARDTRSNRVAQVYRKQGGGFTRNASSPKLAKVKPPMFSRREADLAVKWGRRKGLAVWVDSGKYPFVVCDVAPPNAAVMRRLNEVGRRLGRYVKVISGDRTPYQAWSLRMRFLRGQGNLAALCCGYTGIHSWAACGKAPRSNHARGRAADCGVVHSGRSTGYSNIGSWPGARDAMRREGLGLPVRGEPWRPRHAEVTNVFRA